MMAKAVNPWALLSRYKGTLFYEEWKARNSLSLRS
jgi:hypothetical protein